MNAPLIRLSRLIRLIRLSRLSGLGRRAGDEGLTLVELVVAMSIFLVVTAVFLAALLGMTQSTSRVQNTADASDDLRKAFLRMDRQVRYADAVNAPGTAASGDWYVEFRTSDRPAGAPTLCTQWRYDVSDGRLEVRTWTDGASPAAGWNTIATTVQDPATAPFTLDLATSQRPFQRLGVDLTAGRGTGASSGTAQVDTVFVARNSSLSSPSNVDADADGVNDTVCTSGTRS